MTDPRRAWLEGVSKEAGGQGGSCCFRQFFPISLPARLGAVLRNPSARHSALSLRNQTRPGPPPQSRNPCRGPLCAGWGAGHSHLPLGSILSCEQASRWSPLFPVPEMCFPRCLFGQAGHSKLSRNLAPSERPSLTHWVGSPQQPGHAHSLTAGTACRSCSTAGARAPSLHISWHLREALNRWYSLHPVKGPRGRGETQVPPVTRSPTPSWVQLPTKDGAAGPPPTATPPPSPTLAGRWQNQSPLVAVQHCSLHMFCLSSFQTNTVLRRN